MNYIGIDIGSKGAICSITPKEIVFIDFALIEYIKYLRELNPSETLIGIEKVHSMPKQGVKAMFSFGQRLGEIEGILQTLKLPYELVFPKIWQKNLSIPLKSTKKDIADTLYKLYPKVDLRGSRGGLKDGRSDSLGIAHYIRVKYNKE